MKCEDCEKVKRKNSSDMVGFYYTWIASFAIAFVIGFFIYESTLIAVFFFLLCLITFSLLNLVFSVEKLLYLKEKQLGEK